MLKKYSFHRLLCGQSKSLLVACCLWVLAAQTNAQIEFEGNGKLTTLTINGDTIKLPDNKNIQTLTDKKRGEVREFLAKQIGSAITNITNTELQLATFYTWLWGSNTLDRNILPDLNTLQADLKPGSARTIRPLTQLPDYTTQLTIKYCNRIFIRLKKARIKER